MKNKYSTLMIFINFQKLKVFNSFIGNHTFVFYSTRLYYYSTVFPPTRSYASGRFSFRLVSVNIETAMDPQHIEATSYIEIPPMPRTNPLSVSELHDVQALLGKAKATGAGAPKCEPLSGRRVMVPVTSKAFFEGVLNPPVKSNGWSGSIGRTFDEEVVRVHTGEGKYVDMTRSEASEYFEEELSTLDKTKKSPVPSIKQKSALKKVNKSTERAKPHDHSGITETTNEEPTEPTWPLMEIREECDSNGNFLRSEVVNMSDEMKRLDETFKHASITDEIGDGKKLGNLLAQSLKAGDGSIMKYDDFSIAQNEKLCSENAKLGTLESKSKQQSQAERDEEYLVIRRRLEELEKMEVEDEKAKSENIKSSTRLQSRGWSRGFLNNSSKKKTIKKSSPIAGHQHANKKIMNEQKMAEHSTASDQNAAFVQAKSKVSFSATNEVKEIPRIGVSKVPKKTSSLVLDPSKLDVPDQIKAFPPMPSVPFEEKVFRGVVKERNSLAPCAGNEKISVDNAGVASVIGEVPGKKKLSRFAQQRQQQRG